MISQLTDNKSCSISKSSINPWSQIASFTAYVRAMHSASVIDRDTVDCKVYRQLTGAYDKVKAYFVVD